LTPDIGIASETVTHTNSPPWFTQWPNGANFLVDNQSAA
jgi:hypothetical protein